MSKHDDRVSMQDMLDHAREACELLGNLQTEDLRNDRLRQLALTQLIEIVGEAANRVSPKTRQAHPGLPWPQIIGTRNRLIHGYDIIDYGLLWNTVTFDLPPLIEQLEIILSKEI